MGDKTDQYSFQQKVWISGGIFSLIVVILLLLKTSFSVLLLVLAGVLIAVFFKGFAGLIQKKTGWKEGLCTFLSVMITLLLLALILWLTGSKIQEQAAQLSETLPQTTAKAKDWIDNSPIGQKVVERLSSAESSGKAQSLIKTFFTSTFGVLGDIYVVLFLGLFLTASPQLYTSGIVKLVPAAGRARAQDIVNKLGDSLKKWLKGKLFSMFIVFVLTAIGLAIIGVPMWLVLALIAGLLSFIPNFGPLMALVVAALVGLMQGPTTTLWIIGLYVLVQLLESNVITPQVQQKLISVPPALLIFGQLMMGVLTGGWGLVLATPVLLIVMVMVQELYVKKQDANGRQFPGN